MNQSSTSDPSNKTNDEGNSVYLVGIVASLGDLPSLEKVVRGLSEEPKFAVAIILDECIEASSGDDSVSAESVSPSLFEQWTNLPVERPESGEVPRAGRIYLAPVGWRLTVHNRLFAFDVSAEEADEPLCKDRFLSSLAGAWGERAVALILSGGSSDGVGGARAIKAEGGFVFVREPGDGEPSILPRAVVQAGFADVIEASESMAERIYRVMRAADVREPLGDEELSAEDYSAVDRILTQVRLVCNHDFSHYRSSTVLRRIRRRLPLKELDSLSEYADAIRESREETLKLFEDMLITVTEFFRDPAVYEHLEKEVIPQLFGNKGGKDTVRVWSAGCATGEEAYSLAMLLEEYASKMESPPAIMVFASDVHSRALQFAREGFYPAAIAEQVSEERLRRFFSRVDDSYRVRKSLRDRIVFAPHSMLRDPPFSRIDLVCCRNVLIYMKREVQRRLLEFFHYSLRPGGFLVIGSAETVEDSEVFRLVRKEVNLYRRHKMSPSNVRLPVTMLDDSMGLNSSSEAHRTGLPSGASYGSLHQSFVEQYGPPSVLVNEDHNIVHFSDMANRYLFQPSGEPTNNLFKRIRLELRVELRSALFAATREKKNARSKPVRMELEGVEREVRVRVHHPGGASNEGYLLVWFDESEPGTEQEPHVASGVPNSEIQKVENELEETRNRLQALIEEYETSQEEMRSSNEELQSTNEELRSTLEELETGKEELQSVNEELTTVNQENQRKVQELSRMTNDLNNFLAATDIATVFLDHELCILRFTPQARRIFNIRQGDLGRPMSDLSSRLEYDNFAEDTREVSERQEPLEREVSDGEGQWFQLRILPYRTQEEQVRGVVITLHDISKLKDAETTASGQREKLEILTEDLEARVERRTRQVRDLAGRITMAEQAERNRVAQILHDDFQQELCSLQLEVKMELDGGFLKAEIADRLSESLADLIELTRRLTVDLSPPLLENEGFADGLRYLRSLMGDQYGMDIRLSHETGMPVWNTDLRILMFQIVRELFFNAYKHSGVKLVEVHLEQDAEHLKVRVHDGGKGFHKEILTSDTHNGTGRGLRDLTNRLNFVGGEVEIDSAPGAGCQVNLKIPNKPSEKAEV